MKLRTPRAVLARRLAVATTALLGTALTPLAAYAQDGTWTGPGPNFSSSANWTPNAVPSNRAAFSNTGPTFIQVMTTNTLNQLQFGPNAPAYNITNAGGTFTLNHRPAVDDPVGDADEGEVAMVKAVLGILLSIGIVIGGVTLVDELDLLTTDAMYDQVRDCGEANFLPGHEQVNCWGRFREQAAASDGKEKLLGAIVGLAIAGLGWLLAWFFHIRPRRRRAEAADTAL